MSEFNTLLSESVDRGDCLLLVMSKRRREADTNLDKLTVRPVEINGERKYQFTSFVDGKQTHENIEADETIRRAVELVGTTFDHGHLYTSEADYSIRQKRNGTVRIKKKPPTKEATSTEHNRVRNYLIPEGTPCAFLAEIGVMASAGKVRAAKYQKFRQINRFLELVDDILDHLPQEGQLHIVDFGCGKSYLTFALHYFLTVIRGREVCIVGLDRSEDVIAECSRISEKLGCEGLEFRMGDIADHHTEEQVHLAVSLHACDTATDDAIAKAIRWRANVILAVPCCQHELAKKIRIDSLTPIQKQGILNERFAAVATDALRAQALEIRGYKTQVLEFIDMEHTAKNLLIRAVRRMNTNSVNSESSAAIAERIDVYNRFKDSLGVEELYLDSILESVEL